MMHHTKGLLVNNETSPPITREEIKYVIKDVRAACRWIDECAMQLMESDKFFDYDTTMSATEAIEMSSCMRKAALELRRMLNWEGMDNNELIAHMEENVTEIRRLLKPFYTTPAAIYSHNSGARNAFLNPKKVRDTPRLDDLHKSTLQGLVSIKKCDECANTFLSQHKS